MKAFLLMSPEQQRMQQQNPWAPMADKMGFHDKGRTPWPKKELLENFAIAIVTLFYHMKSIMQRLKE